jgi:TPP-dependent pyruvate/acetoin dehydrogenase alpha subunit
VPEEVREWYRESDPVLVYIRELVDARSATREEIGEIDGQVRAEIAVAAEFALASPFPEPEEALRDVFAVGNS